MVIPRSRVFTGQKVFTTGAHYSSHICLLARTAPELPRHKGLSIFVFPLESPGVTVRPIYTMGGIRTNEVFLDRVRVPPSAMIGAPNSGFYTIAVALDFERIIMGKYARLRRTFTELVACCRHLSRDGCTLYEDPAVQDRLVGLHITIERLRLLCFKAAWMVDKCLVPTAEASAQKVMASELEQRLADEGMKILGPCGQLGHGSPHTPMEGRLVSSWLLALMMRFGGGTNERAGLIDAIADAGLPVTTPSAPAGGTGWAAYDILADVAGVSMGVVLTVPAGGLATLVVVDHNIRQAAYNWGTWTIRVVVREVGSAGLTGETSKAGAYAEMLHLRMQAQSVPVTNGVANPYQRDLLRAANLSWPRRSAPSTRTWWTATCGTAASRWTSSLTCPRRCFSTCHPWTCKS